MSPIFTIAAGLVVVLAVALTLSAQRRSRPNWTAVAMVVGILAIVIAATLFLLMIFRLAGESDGNT